MAKRRGNGEGTIAQRASDGRWVGAFQLPDGKRKYVYGRTRAEAAEKLKQAMRQVDDGIDLNAEKMTLAAFLDRWLASSVKPSVKVRTYEGYESIVRVRVVPRIGKKPLAKVTALDCQHLYSRLAEAGLSARSIVHTHRVLHRAFEQAIKWNLIQRNPADGATAPRAQRSEMRVLTPREVNVFLAATIEHPAHALYVLAITTGMRAGEVLGLKWADVDLDLGRLTIKRALQQQNGGKGLVFVTPKSSRSRRTIVLGQRAIEALRAHRDRQTFKRRAVGDEWRDLDLVFSGPKGGPVDPSWSRQTFYAALDAAGMPRVRFHDLRHTAATLLLAQGVHPKVVSELLGHSTIGLTLDTYSHMLPAMHQQAAAAMDAIIAI
jgi:integrase